MSHRDGIREKRNIYKGIFFYVTKFSEALCRVQVNSVVHESVMFSNVIVDRTFPHRSFVFSQSSCEVSASRTDILTLKKSMADSLDNGVQVYLGSSWLVLPLPYSGMTLSLLIPALQTGHTDLLGRVSSHWKTKKEHITRSRKMVNFELGHCL